VLLLLGQARSRRRPSRLHFIPSAALLGPKRFQRADRCSAARRDKTGQNR
jgi:hypothetical protein